MDLYNMDVWSFLLLMIITVITAWLILPGGFNIFDMKEEAGKNKAKSAYTNLPKFEFKMEGDQAFIVHNDFPKCLAKLGDDDNLFDEIKWGNIAPKALKEEAIREMTDWYWLDLQGMPKEN